MELVVRPVGFVCSPFKEKMDAPRQAVVAADVAATIEMLPEYRDALDDLDGVGRLWLLFWFHRSEGWNPKVLPPRSDTKRGLFATRSPHRPNPIGLSAVRLERVDGLALHVRDIDLVDGTPILDIKPYVPYADSFPESTTGWLERTDPRKEWKVVFEPIAEEALTWLEREAGNSPRERIAAALALGPQPHAYRRIKEIGGGRRILAVKDWRAEFRVDDPGRLLVVERIRSGYRPRDLAEGTDPVHALHRAFVARFGAE